MTTALYRINSGEVLKLSPKNQQFADRDVRYWGVLVDPPTPDGTEVRPFRQLGTAKYWDGVNVRNATQAEIDTFAVVEADDESELDAEQATSMVELHPMYRKVFKAILKRVVIAELVESTNANIEGVKSAIANSNNLAEIKSAVAALPTLPTSVNLAQVVTALKNEISKAD